MATFFDLITLCSELVTIRRREAADADSANGAGVLEEIQGNSAVLWVDSALNAGEELAINHRFGCLNAKVTGCAAQADGFLVKLRISDDCFLPKHALLVSNARAAAA